MNPEIFSIGDLSIRWYSVLILFGMIIAVRLAERESKKFKFEKDFVFDIAFWIIVFGIIGARLYYVIFNFELYKNDLLGIFKVWNGGLAIHGGILAGLITLIVYCKKKDIKVLRVTDIAVPSLIIAQSIGRWGNFFNSEAHGPMTTLENLQNLHIPNFIIEGMKIGGVYYHPTFLYESIWCLIGFIILLIVRKYYKSLKCGQLTCIYLMWYGVGRLFIESLRTDSLMLGNLKVAQLISIAMIVVGILFFLYLCFNRLRKGKYYDKEEMN
jgi:phosphatidylglycerol:prolipoprotein diacylglycerol transferase